MAPGLNGLNFYFLYFFRGSKCDTSGFVINELANCSEPVKGPTFDDCEGIQSPVGYVIIQPVFLTTALRRQTPSNYVG